MAQSKAVILAFSTLAALSASASAATYAITGRIAGPDGGWDLASVDDTGRRLYVARTDGVMAVDLATGTVTAKLVTLQRGHGVLAIPGTGRVIAASGEANSVMLFEGATGQVIKTLPVGTKPDAVAYDPATRTIWVMCPGSGDISVIDPQTAAVIATVPVGGSLELAVADGQGKLFVNVEDKNEVAVIDTRARTVLRRFPLAGCDGPTGIAYAAHEQLIVSACANGVAKITKTDGSDAGSIKIGPRPDGAAFDEAGQRVLIPSGGDGTLAVIGLEPKPELLATVTTQPGTRTIALDQSTGAAYLPSAQFVPNPAGGRPLAVPGSFAVIVVKPTSASPD